jgi:hypothetical protein
MPFVLVSWAGDIVLECWQNGGGSEKYTTHGKNTAAGGYGRGLKLVISPQQTEEATVIPNTSLPVPDYGVSLLWSWVHIGSRESINTSTNTRSWNAHGNWFIMPGTILNCMSRTKQLRIINLSTKHQEDVDRPINIIRTPNAGEFDCQLEGFMLK